MSNHNNSKTRERTHLYQQKLVRLAWCCCAVLAVSDNTLACVAFRVPVPLQRTASCSFDRQQPLKSQHIITRNDFHKERLRPTKSELYVSPSSHSEPPISKSPNTKKTAKSKNNYESKRNGTSSKTVDDLVAKIGLNPVPPRAKQRRTNKRDNNYVPPNRPSLRAQLEYARNGHCVLRKHVKTALLNGIRNDLEKYAKENEVSAWRQKVEVASGNQSLAACETVEDCIQELSRLGISWDRLPFLQYFNTWRALPTVKQLAYDLAETAAILLDVPSVRLYQDSFFWKRSNDGPTPWHTDARMAPFDTSNMLTIWIPLHDIPVDGSALHFVSKSHADFALPFWSPYVGGENTEKEWTALDERYQHHETVDYMPLAMGDITVHSGWTLHCADSQDANTSNTASANDRLALAISYVDARAPVRKNVLSKADHGDDEDQWSYVDWVREVLPGQPFEHPLVPVVWTAS